MTPAAAGRLGALGDRPGARLLGPDGEIGDEAEQFVAGADDPVEAGLGKADGVEVILLLGGVEDGDLALDLGRDDDGLGALLPGALEHQCRKTHCPGRPRPPRRCRRRARAWRSGGRASGTARSSSGLRSTSAGRLALAQEREGAVDEVEGLLGFLVVALGLLLERRERASRGCRDRPASARSRWSRYRRSGRSCPPRG